MTADVLFAALNLPTLARVDQRVPKSMLLEHATTTAADKRLINDSIEEIRWLAALKPTTCGVPQFRDTSREYLEIAVLKLVLRERPKAGRLVELVHRAVPYPLVLLIDNGGNASVSLVHKRHALKESGKVVLDGLPVTVDLAPAPDDIRADFLAALDLALQPTATLSALYEGWLDTTFALQAALMTGAFKVLDSAKLAAARRDAIHASLALLEQLTRLRSAAAKSSQMARQVELNIDIKRLQAELAAAHAHL